MKDISDTGILSSSWIDVSLTIHNDMMIWPGDPPVKIEKIRDFGRGDDYSISKLSMVSHSGTHVDAPAHFIEGGKSVDMIPLELLIGPVRVIEIPEKEKIEIADLSGNGLRRGERVFFKTKNSVLYLEENKFCENFTHLSAAASQYLTEIGVSLVGIDYLSIESFAGDDDEVHRVLLGAGICIVEGLDLSRVTPGYYEMVCLPLKIGGGDGAPARVILRSLDSQD